jgi:catechol 2,3-dioxygenase-like lactoylglutathione lyase family enzyme
MKIMKYAVVLITLGVATSCFAAAAAETVQTTNQSAMSQTNSNIVSVRYMIDDVDAAVAFYTNHLGFRLDVDSSPAFASVVRGNLRLLLSGEKSSGHRPLPDGTKPIPGGWNRILLEVSDINAEAARLRAAGVKFRRDDIVSGPGGSQIWVVDPSGNLVELFQPK